MMAISTKGRYSVRILALMASRPAGHVFSRHDIAEAEGISPTYVQQLMMSLRTAGLVSSHRGRVGGFALARDPATISVADVLRTSEGPIELAPCLGGVKCEREPGCTTRALWIKASAMLDELFAAVSIEDLARGDAGL